MKASEVLNQYAAGERTFQRLNLRGQSFEGQDLSGVDFSEADIRSANFAGANLKGANFTAARCGLQKRWATLLTIIICLLTAISDYLSILIPFVVSLILEASSFKNQIPGWMGLIILVSFLFLMIRQGIIPAAIVAIVAGLVTGAAGLVTGTPGLINYAAGLIAYIVAIAYVASVAAIVATVAAVAVEEILVVVALAIVAAAIAIVVAVLGVYAGALTGVGICIGWRSWKGDQRDSWLRSLAVNFAALGGTSFRSANLTNANFARAKLKSTDFREANLTGVYWYGATMLERVRPGNTYLNNPQVRQWLIGKGIDKNFDGQKLQGINLQGADLKYASFIDANLSKANLKDADLSRAKLVRTQLHQTNLTGATLTGACIEDWGVTTSSKLDDVQCEYVLMRLPTKENPQLCRKPDNESEIFQAGEFIDFVQPVFDTLDLYHSQGVDPRAIAIAWKDLAENNPDAQLKFASLEVKGEDCLLLRLKTTADADLSKLSGEYFETYNQLKALAKTEYKELIAEKDDLIQQLENMINTALKRPDFYTQNCTYPGDNKLLGDRNLKM